MTEKGASGGQPGNKNAVRAKRFRNALERALAREGKGDMDAGLNALTTTLVREAKKGEAWAMKEVADRIDGRVPQAVEMTGEGGGEIVVRDANTTMGIARRVAFVLARGAIAAAAKAVEDEQRGDGAVAPAGEQGGRGE